MSQWKDQDDFIAALFREYYPTQECARILLIYLVLAKDKISTDDEYWDSLFEFAQEVTIALDGAIKERDEARQQLADAREQLHKIGRKAFWAGKA